LCDRGAEDPAADLSWRAIAVIVTVGLAPTLLWRRTRPLLMVAIVLVTTGLASLLTSGEIPGLNTMAYVLILPYSLPRWGSGREVVTVPDRRGSTAPRLGTGRALPRSGQHGFVLLQALCFVGPHGEFDSISGVKFGHQTGEMELDGAHADVKFFGDLGVSFLARPCGALLPHVL
jgi:hypothetical protein